MSYVQKNMKFLKAKEKNLKFFESYLDISKLRILQVLNTEQKALDSLKLIKYSNSKLLEKINDNFFKNERTFIEVADETRKTKEEIYFLVDSKENDKYNEVAYKKLEEFLEAKVLRNDSVITIGNRVNLIAQKLELNIIQHFPYELYENQSEFINKVASLIEIGFKNGVFSDATLIIAQQNQDNKNFVMKKLAPFEYEKINQEVFASKKLDDLESQSNLDEHGNKKVDSSVTYIKYLDDLDVKQISFIPNINFFKYKLTKAIIKQSVVELKLIEKIQRLKLEIQLLDEKKSKIQDDLTVVQRLINRVRREKETESSIVLYSAFKVRKQDGDVLETSVGKKKKEDDTLLISKGGTR